MENKKILIIEDNIVTLGDIEMRLGKMGYENTETAVSGEEAIEIAEWFNPDLILSDINLGKGITGIEAVQQIKQKHDVPVVYLTAYDDDKTLAEAGVTEPYAYLLKPLQERELQISLSIALYKHKIENELKDSEESFRAITTQARDAIILIDKNDEIKFWNKEAEKIFGYKSSELLGKKLHAIIVPEKYHEKQKEAFKHFQETGEGNALNKTLELSGLRKNGKEFPIEISLAKLHIKNKLHAVAIIRDITERKKIENELKDKNDKLEEAIATKDKFFNIIAHDLKSPFSAILGFSDLLITNIDTYDKEKIKRFVTTIHQSGKNVFKLLENLLQWARSQQDKIPFEPTENNLYNIANETFMLISGNAKDKNITVDLNIAKDIRIVADSEMLKTIIRNLVSNAIKYTSENGKITIAGKQINEDEVIIEIADTGTGMDEQTKNSLFKIGATKSKQGTKGERGTGFGLLLCKEFVEKHNGRISVESELNKGSKFKIFLPRNQINNLIMNK